MTRFPRYRCFLSDLTGLARSASIDGFTLITYLNFYASEMVLALPPVYSGQGV